ncbi:hypothetical protein C4569_02825 [Candidatus Parcubacteria bacterium]|nr:MAG: hypothetical protein C4569_02825 [Candidatus Parcubacteria bacterium]
MTRQAIKALKLAIQANGMAAKSYKLLAQEERDQKAKSVLRDMILTEEMNSVLIRILKRRD